MKKKLEVYLFRNLRTNAPDFWLKENQSSDMVMAELTEICGVNGTVAELVAQIPIIVDKGWSINTAFKEKPTPEQHRFAEAVMCDLTVLLYYKIKGKPLVVNGITMKPDLEKIPEATILLSDRIAEKIKAAML